MLWMLRPVLYLTLAVLLVFCGYLVRQTQGEREVDFQLKQSMMSGYGIGSGAHKHLASRFADAHGNLTADAPTDPSRLADPDDLRFAYLQKDVDGAESIAWSELAKAIETATGKHVASQNLEGDKDDLKTIQEQGFHVLIVHAADTPYLVNELGYVPFAVAGDDHGPHGHRLNLIASANSQIQTPEEIKGHTLMATEPRSITGYRAGIAYLQQTYGLRPELDFAVNFSTSQRNSILGIAGGSMEVAEVSSDKLRSMTRKGEVSDKSYRIIYESEVIPRFAVCYSYNLKPELVAGIKKAVLGFVNPPAAAEVSNAEVPRPVRFIPANYAKDFVMIRTMDDAFESRLREVPEPPATQTALHN